MEKKYEKPSMQVVVMNKQAMVLLTSGRGVSGSAGFDTSMYLLDGGEIGD